jgi:DNA-cytosine methyltransferase
MHSHIIKIADFLKKNIDPQIREIYGPEDLDEQGNLLSFNEQVALITHYAMLRDDARNRQSYSQAIDVLNGWYRWIDQNRNAARQYGDDMVADGADAFQTYLFNDLFDVPFPTPENPHFTFIDLFAGIGGFRLAMQNLGGKCVYSSEWDEQAQKTYFTNYGEVPFGDITKESTKSFIPDGFDILCAGFPCQAFSLAGRRRGFEETRGTLFFDVAEILRRKQPKAIFLENVKGLKIHDHGRTFEVIKNALREVGYTIADDPAVVNAMYFGVPQHRERVYIIGVRNDIAHRLGITSESIKDAYPLQEFRNGIKPRFMDIREENEVSVKYYLSTQYIQTLINHKARHAAKGNGFGYEIIPDDGIANAIVVGGMGRERNLVVDDRLTNFVPITRIKGEVNHDGIRKMTPREWARLQGFPDNFIIPVADASAYKQFGNSVAVPAIQATASNLLNLINI